jgi:hypothetical protein
LREVILGEGGSPSQALPPSSTGIKNGGMVAKNRALLALLLQQQESNYPPPQTMSQLASGKTGTAKIVEDELSMYRQLEAQQNYILSGRSASIAQLKENEMVADELSRLPADADVFKLVGPVLMRQVNILLIL